MISLKGIMKICFVIIIISFLLPNITLKVLADIVDFSDNAVDSDSDIDSLTIGNSQGSYINAQTLNSVFQNITEGNGNQYDSGSDFEHYTDGNQDVYSPSDLGTYSNWGTMILTDSTYNTLTEENTGSAGNNIEDFTDTLTDSQIPSDLGSYTDFNEMKDIDSNYNSMTEEDTGSAGNNVEDYLDGYADQYSPSDLGTYSDWSLMQNKDDSDNILAEEDTGSAGNNVEDFVDTFTNNHDPVEIGTHSNSANLQAKDTNMDTLTEVDENSATNDEDFVDTNTNNHDPIDKGTYGDFNELKDIDSVTTTLTEENMGGAGGSEWLDVNNLDNTWTDWDTPTGDSPYLNAQDEPANYLWEKNTGGKQHGWFEFPDTSLSGSGITVNVSIYCANSDGAGNDGFDVYWDAGGGGGTLLSWYQPDTTYAYITVEVSGTFTATEVNAFRIYLGTHMQSQGDDIYADHARIGTSQSALDDYEFDREFQFSSQDFNDDNEELCIFTGTVPLETLLIDVWYSSSWTNIGSIVDANDDVWINISISTYLTGSDIEFRFVGNDESSDTTSSVWNFDGILIHTWDNANYRLDLEFQFASLDYDETTGEELCIFTGTINAETINIDIWDSSAWTNIGSIVDANDGVWVNISISAYLDASTEDFRFEDATKTSDSTEHTWNLDAVLIHSWTDPVINYEFDRELSFSSLDFDETTGEELCVFTGTIGTETINIDVYDGSWTNIGSIVDANDNTWVNISISTYLDSASEYFRFIGNSEAGDTTQNTWGIDGILIHSWTDPVVNYEFDRQFNFQSLDFDETTGEELCIKTGTIQAESLKVDVWDGSWINILTIVDVDDNTWKNLSISTYLDSASEDFRFIGNSESGDNTQETWQIDGILIHSWTAPSPNYQFDREFNFTSVDFNEQNEELCIKTGTMQAESLKVDVWDGSWTNILTITDSDDNTWKNVSISSYLDSASENFRFVGASESGDSNQESWEIDSALLHIWNNTVLDYELDWESQIQSVLSNQEHYNLTVWGNYSDSENVSVQLWNYTDSSWLDSGQNISTSEMWYNLSLDSFSGVIDENVTVRYLANNESLDAVLSFLLLDYVGISSWNVSAESNDPPQISSWYDPSNLIDQMADVLFYVVIYDSDNISTELTIRLYYTNDSFGSINISVDMNYASSPSADHYNFTYLFSGKPEGTYYYYYQAYDGANVVKKPAEVGVWFKIEWDPPITPPTTTSSSILPSLNSPPGLDPLLGLLALLLMFILCVGGYFSYQIKNEKMTVDDIPGFKRISKIINGTGNFLVIKYDQVREQFSLIVNKITSRFRQPIVEQELDQPLRASQQRLMTQLGEQVRAQRLRMKEIEQRISDSQPTIKTQRSGQKILHSQKELRRQIEPTIRSSQDNLEKEIVHQARSLDIDQPLRASQDEVISSLRASQDEVISSLRASQQEFVSAFIPPSQEPAVRSFAKRLRERFRK